MDKPTNRSLRKYGIDTPGTARVEIWFGCNTLSSGLETFLQDRDVMLTPISISATHTIDTLDYTMLKDINTVLDWHHKMRRIDTCMHVFGMAFAILVLFGGPPAAHTAEPAPNVPVLVPITGFLAAEGNSQRNGALLALQNPPAGVKPRFAVTDTGTSPEGAVNALERALSDGDVTVVVASMLGTQMLAMLPIAQAQKVPLITMSGTADITRKGNPYVFRFFPADSVVKGAQVKYAIEAHHIQKPAVIYQTTAYGQSGHTEILAALAAAGIKPVYEDALDVGVKDMRPVIAKAVASGADSLLLQLHGGPTALFLKAVAAMDVHLPIVAGSALSQPATVALLEPAEIKGVCGETGSSPISAETPAMQDFLARYRTAFHTDPDGFALGQYDATMMALNAVAKGASTAESVTKALAADSYQGVAMTYKSDGHGNMAHSAVIICFDGTSRVPAVVRHYDFPAAP